ncbi:hypothetical protein XI06_40520 [Bradyrhizobium sp. CCBAU 11434]|nr:hypothetical protein [Bradyrhizobium sp. CCBAU 11434]
MSGFAEGVLTLRTWGKGFGFFTEAFGFLGEAFFKGSGLLESAAPLHDTTSSLRVLTAGFEFSQILIRRRGGFSSKVLWVISGLP